MDQTTEHQSQNASIRGLSKAVLVTGGAGYVGSHTCKLLAKNGYLPVTVDRHFREGLVSFGPNYNFEQKSGDSNSQYVSEQNVPE